MADQSQTEICRSLVDPATGKVWRGSLQGTDVMIATGSPDKLRERTKNFDSRDSAVVYLEKQQWTKLKNGYFLHNENAEAGDPTLHRYLGGAYTGMLALAASSEHVFCCNYLQPTDLVLTLDERGGAAEAIAIPEGRLVLDMTYSSELQRLLVNADHRIMAMNPHDFDGFQTISNCPGLPASCLSTSGTRIVCFEESTVMVTDLLASEIVFQVKRTPELYGGHSPQLCASLSRDGKLLAICLRPGEVELFDVEGGSVIRKIAADFNMISQLEFDFANELLVGVGAYGPWGPLFFDLKKLALVPSPFELPPLRDGTVNIAFDSAKPRLALASGKTVYIFDMETGLQSSVVHLDNVVKQVKVCFALGKIAVRTDYGCLSLYAID